MPDAFLREAIRPDLPAPGSYAVGLVFLPGAAHRRVELSKAVAAVERIAREEGLRALAWRDVPVEDGPIGPTARGSLPTFRQLVVADANSQRHGRALDIAAFRLRRRAEREHGVYMSGLSTTTMVYKGMLTPHQLPGFFPDLRDEVMTSRLALVHSRFSTNTFPSWDLAQPFRMIAHNGEINTVRGNRNWMAARQGRLASQTLGDLSPLMPVTTDGASDSASLDEVLELLVLAGRPLPLAMAMMIPQAWENDPRIGEDLRAFYRYHQALMEPWDGPAAVTFTDGRQIGALIDRNGLRPGRWLVTEDDLVVLASETGVFDVPEDRIRSKGRLEPGQMFFVDLDGGRIIPDSEIKAGLASAAPWREWLEEGIVSLNDLPSREHIDHSRSSVLRRLQEFGYTQEDLDVILAPMAASGAAVHHHLLRRHTRTLVGLIVEAGDVREVHHVATLIGYGASAVTPYLAMEAAEELARTGRLGSTSADEAVAHLIKALGKGVLKVMSKMGISTVSSYCGAQVFRAIGLDEDFVARYFTGTPSPLGGIGIDVIAREVAERHAIAYPPSGISPAHRALDVGGEYRWRREGEEHLFTPENIARLQTATWTASREIFREYTRGVGDQSERLMTLRGLMRLRTDEVEPVPLEEVEPVSEIVKRFATGAMSFGSISREAHETMAIAMNTLGARSNSGEGGEAPERLRDPLRNSAIKQVASGRFGVTADYLSHARDIQIKMAQGAKPGEGGQLPAAKVYPWVAQERHSTPRHRTHLTAAAP